MWLYNHVSHKNSDGNILLPFFPGLLEVQVFFFSRSCTEKKEVKTKIPHLSEAKTGNMSQEDRRQSPHLMLRRGDQDFSPTKSSPT